MRAANEKPEGGTLSTWHFRPAELCVSEHVARRGKYAFDDENHEDHEDHEDHKERTVLAECRMSDLAKASAHLVASLPFLVIFVSFVSFVTSACGKKGCPHPRKQALNQERAERRL